MGALKSLITGISNDVVAALAAAGYPPLTPQPDGTAGAILVGTAALFEALSPPRIIFEPVGWKLGAAEYASSSATLTTLERQNQKALRTVRAKDVAFLCRCWGASATGNPVDDYDVTEALSDQVIATLQKLLPGAHSVEESGKYTAGPNINRLGREVVFGVTLLRPVLGALAPYDLANSTPAQIAAVVDALYAPVGTVISGTDRLVLPDGSGASEPGCE